MVELRGVVRDATREMANNLKLRQPEKRLCGAKWCFDYTETRFVRFQAAYGFCLQAHFV